LCPGLRQVVAGDVLELGDELARLFPFAVLVERELTGDGWEAPGLDVVGEHGMVEAFLVRDRLGEHLIAEILLKAAPRVCILATSREENGCIASIPWNSRRTRPISRPTRQYSAVQLFVERAMASAGGFDIADADVPAVLEICRSLDGMPLALELAGGPCRCVRYHGLTLSNVFCDNIRVGTKPS
jgi:hypothetical protein